MIRVFVRGCGVSGLMLLAACNTPPPGPTVAVTPGPGKSDAAFQEDRNFCMSQAKASVTGQVTTANTQNAVGAVVGVVAGATTQDAAVGGVQAGAQAQGAIQQQYDMTFGNCMYTKGQGNRIWNLVDM